MRIRSHCGVTLFFLCVSFAGAQSGFKVGVDAPVGSFASGNVNFKPSVGIGFRFPYGIDDRLSLGTNIGGAQHSVRGGYLVLQSTGSGTKTYSSDSWTLGWLVLEAKYFTSDSSALRPFIAGGAGAAMLYGNSRNYLIGYGLSGSFGLEHFIHPRWSLSGSGTLRQFWFPSATIDGTDVGLVRTLSQTCPTIQFGITYHIPR